MELILLVIHLVLAVALIIVILLQRSEGGALGIGGGGGGGLVSARGSANILSTSTAVLAGLFMVTSLTLAYLARDASQPRSILDGVPAAAGDPVIPGAPAAGTGAPSLPAPPAEPAVPTR